MYDPKLTHGIIQNEDQHEQSSVPKKHLQLYKTGSARGDAWLRRISTNNLLSLENATSLLNHRDVQ